METDIDALKKLIKLIADATRDSISAVGTDSSVIIKILGYQNLIGDFVDLIPKIGEIPTEIGDLSAADYSALASELAQDLGLSDQHVTAIVTASIKLIGDLATVMLPDMKALITAIKTT